MKEFRTDKAQDFIDQKVTLKGWVANFRSSGKISFLQLRDGYGYIQGIASENDLEKAVWDKIQGLSVESSVIVQGTISKHPKKEEYELQVSALEIVQLAAEYPIGKKEHGPDFLLDNRHLWLRSSKQVAIQKIRNTIINAIYEFLNKDGFIKIDSPILTPNACEGTTELFEIDYFKERKAYLSQSGQLYLEAAIMAHSKVFDFGPVFRAEKSKTRRHLTEFWMMDAEMAWVEHEDNLKVQEELISFIVAKVLEINQTELNILERDQEPLKKIKAPFVRMTHAEAVTKLQKLGSDIKEHDDLGGDDETLLTSDVEAPVFVIHWPAEIKAFYMKRNDQGLALCDDLIAPEGFGEIIGGSQREDDYDELLKRIKEHKLPVDQFQWYLDLRQYGSVPHSGFGIGLERLVGWLCGIKHVRETIPFPRMINRLNP
ncbi:MAG: asparagine--tRNA ligase [Parcubacteria group bacterium CG1_02_37_51]|uniref:Asparagine--tRNA ligase n=2 Tax=Candidatus Komeiliibacteriota TaxID=1817908 RepID=A0A2M8DPW3_9BACT|nr:MAG: asparagine--tRNA ligase [Parcubacteria group bacterium CG1_02_37_51]PIY93769.1 MAG: asparagine--tRNA ligase [Candidatus Komeilibacteria bacterium CG_4_10_14_0_8_um_filter_37_78]PJC00941.1 MAG: asparagine--tRNA ligase [Candidatus Komeilibacteria bacterium CG_4_9_14_0_8_um_filter_36_9]